MPTAAATRTRGILRSLRRKYPRRSAPPSGGITNHLAAVILGRDTDGAKAYTACRRLLTEFVDWNEVRVARWGEVERVLRLHVGERRSGDATRRLLYCLQQVFELRGEVGLTALTPDVLSEARKFLLLLNFLDADEVNLVMLLGLGEPVMPVDSNVLRPGKRRGGISHTATKLQAQKALEQSLEGEDLHACYLAMREHARRVCFTESPDCKQCSTRKKCRYSGVH